jgi:hypothetical protein
MGHDFCVLDYGKDSGQDYGFSDFDMILICNSGFGFCDIDYSKNFGLNSGSGFFDTGSDLNSGSNYGF